MKISRDWYTTWGVRKPCIKCTKILDFAAWLLLTQQSLEPQLSNSSSSNFPTVGDDNIISILVIPKTHWPNYGKSQNNILFLIFLMALNYCPCIRIKCYDMVTLRAHSATLKLKQHKNIIIAIFYKTTNFESTHFTYATQNLCNDLWPNARWINMKFVMQFRPGLLCSLFSSSLVIVVFMSHGSSQPH